MVNFALLDVEHAFKQLEFAIKLMCFCERGDLDKERFDSDVTILLGNENIRFPAASFQLDQDIIVAAQINVSICFGVTAIVLDAAFEVVNVKPDPNSEDQQDKLRTLVYMVRCAFAHNPAKPCWEARGPYVRKMQLNVEESNFSIDLGALHGKDFNYSHIGSIANWYKIRKMAVRRIQDRLKSM